MSITNHLNLKCGWFSGQKHSGTFFLFLALHSKHNLFCALLGIVLTTTRWNLFSPLSGWLLIHSGEFPKSGDSPAAGCAESGWVLCFGLGTKEIDNSPVVATDKLPAQCQGLLSFSLCPYSWEWARSWERHSWDSWSRLAKGYPMGIVSWSAAKAQGRGGRE